MTQAIIIEPLTLEEQLDLEKAEKEIHDEISGMIQRQLENFEAIKRTGERLSFIRDGNLWRIKAATWEEYCQTEFSFSRDRAGQIIRAYAVGQNILVQFVEAIQDDIDLGELNTLKQEFADGEIPLPGERALRELLRIPVNLRLKAYLAALKAAGATATTNVHLSASTIKIVVDDVLATGDVTNVHIVSLKHEADQNALLARVKAGYAGLDAPRRQIAMNYFMAL